MLRFTKQRTDRVILISGAMIIILIVLFFDQFQVPKSQLLAKVGNRIINRWEYNNFIAQTGRTLTPDEKKLALDYLVNQEVILQYARYKHKDETLMQPAFRLRSKEAKTNLLLDQLYKTQVDAKAKPQLEQAQTWFNQAKPVSVYFMAVSYLTPNAQETIQKAKSMLEEGFDFYKVQALYGNPRWQKEKSFLGYHQLGVDDLPAGFNQAARGLTTPGAHSPIFTTNFGYVILYRGVNPTWDEAKGEALLKIAQQQKQALANKLVGDFKKKVKLQNPLINVLPDLTLNQYTDMYSKEIATGGDFTLTFGQWYNYLKHVVGVTDLSIYTPQELGTQIIDYLTRQQLANLAIQQELDTDKTYKHKLDKKIREIKEELSYLVLDGMLKQWDISVTEQEMHNYYQQNNQALSSASLLKVQKIVVKNQKDAQQVRTQLQNGQSFSQLVKQYSTEPQAKLTEGISPYLGPTELGVNYDEINSLTKGQISANLKTQDGIMICKLLDKQPGGALSYQDAQAYIHTKLLVSKMDTHVKQLIGEMGIKVEKYYKKLN